MRILLAFALLIALFSIEAITLPSTPSLQIEQNNPFPLIVESINNFTIRTNDIDKLLKVQFKDLKLGNISTSYASITSSTVSISHYTTEKHVDNITPLKVNVTKDDLSLFVIFELKVLHILGSKKYNCNVSIPLVQIGYLKEFDLSTGKVKVSNLKTNFTSKSFSIPQCKQPQSKQDIERVNQIINSTQGSSIYITLLKEFDKMPGYFNANAEDEHLSQIYDTNPYVYRYFNDANISIDVSTVIFQRVGETGLENGLSGKIQGTSTEAVAPPEIQDGYTAFYSKQFFQNLAEYAKNKLPNWKNIKLNGQNMRNRIFRYRLLDFQVLIPTILEKYPQKYLSDIEIQCNFDQMGQLTMTQDEISLKIDWKCLGSLEVAAGKRQTFLNFIVTLKHDLLVTATSQYLTVIVNELSIQNLRFDIIDNHAITDPFTFAYYIQEGLFEFRVYTIGTYFKVNSPNQQIKVLNGRGIWIG